MPAPRLRDLPASLDLLRGFESAARHLSFTAAATELFLTQSAISRQVQQLETQLGVKLFERHTRALTLTAAGALYHREVGRALQLLREATAQVRGEHDSVVRVTTTVTFASLWLVPRLASFQAQHPDIVVHVAADNTVRDLERARLDVAIRYTPPASAGTGAERLFGEEVAPVAAPALLAGHTVTAPEDVLRLPLLDIDDPSSTGSVWLSWQVWCEAMGVPPPGRRRLLFSHYDQIVQAALAGQGVALGRFPLLDPLLARRRLKLALPRKYATLAQRAYWLVLTRSAEQRDDVQRFARWLRAEAAASATATRRVRARRKAA